MFTGNQRKTREIVRFVCVRVYFWLFLLSLVSSVLFFILFVRFISISVTEFHQDKTTDLCPLAAFRVS